MKKGDGKKIVGLLVLILIAAAAIYWQATRPERQLPPFETMPPPGSVPQNPNAGRAIGPAPSDGNDTPSPPKQKEDASKKESG